MTGTGDAGPGGSSPPLRIAVAGAGGRMGSELLRVIAESDGLMLAAAVESRGALAEAARAVASRGGAAAAAPAISIDRLRARDFDVCVEFTRGDAIAEVAPALAALGKPWVSGTTGLDPAGRAAIDKAAQSIPVLWSPNMSLGVTLLSRLLDLAGRFLPEGWELEIVETHHGAKRDAPSGTALALAEKWRAVRGGEIRSGREGLTGPRPGGEIGIHAVRLPEGVGEHRLLLGGRGEGIEIAHRATDRAAFARGAIEAARWLAGQRKAGLYTLEDWAGDRLRETAR